MFPPLQVAMDCVREGPHGRILGVLTLEEVLKSPLGDLREGKSPRP